MDKNKEILKCDHCTFWHYATFIWCPSCGKLQNKYKETIGEEMNKVGDEIVNGAGNLVRIKKECLKCQTFTKNTKHGAYKCCMKSSCPGWTKPTSRANMPRRHGYR